MKKRHDLFAAANLLAIIPAGFLLALTPARATNPTLNMLFVNQTGLPDSDVFITFQDPNKTLDATYSGGAQIGRVSTTDVMTNSLSLTTIGAGGLNIANAEGPVVFVSYKSAALGMTGNLSGNFEPSYIGSAGANYQQAYQPFELTYVSGAISGQGNLTNINYFAAPISIQSYHGGVGGTKLENRGYLGGTANGTAQLATKLAKMTAGPNSSLATATKNGAVLRYIGPSSYGAGTNPYPIFDGYLGALNSANQTTHIKNSNAFNTQAIPAAGNINYNYTLDLIATVAADKTITLTGNIYTTMIPFGGTATAGTTYTGAVMTISPTTGKQTNDAIFNNTIYGQADPYGSGNGSTTFNSVWGNLATDMANAGLYLNTVAAGMTYSITQSLAIGEITTGLLGGFVGSNATYSDGQGQYATYNGQLYKNVPSVAWWYTSTIPAMRTLQPSNLFYSQWSETIFNATSNEVYSIPFSDRFGQGPLMQTQLYNNKTVDTWVVTLGVPIFAVPEPSTTTPSAGLLSAGKAQNYSVKFRPKGKVLKDGYTTIQLGKAPTTNKAGVNSSFIITNTGKKPLTGLKITKDGAAAADFTITGLNKKPLPPGKSITVNVTFRPKTEGNKQAFLHITSNESLDNPFDLTLIGTGMRAKKPR